MNLFEMFGIPEEEASKKNNTNNTKTKTTEKKSAPKEVTYSLPLNVFVGAYGLLEIAEDGKSKMNEDEIRSFIAARIKGYPKDCTRIEKAGKDIKVALVSSGKEKGSVSVLEDTVFVFGNMEIDISTLDSVNGSVEISDLQKLFKENFPYMNSDSIHCSVLSTDDNKIITLSVTGQVVDEIPEPENKILIYFQNGDMIEITKETYQDLLKSKGTNEQDDSDESSSVVIELNDIESLFPEKVHYNETMIQLIETADKDTYYINQKILKETKTSNGSKKYKIDGVVISLLFRDYTVTAEDFGGRSSVEEEEIVHYLVNKGHKEFSYTGVNIQEVSKANMIIVSAKGSRKGADNSFPKDIEEFANTLQCMDFNSIITRDSCSYLVKKHPCFICACPVDREGDTAYFKWTGPMIPDSIWQEGYMLSKMIYEMYGAEVMLELYYSPQYQTYAWNVPQQTVRKDSTEAKFEQYLQSGSMSGLVKVGQFHSHGVFPAYFSSIDNKDEQTCGIYGVWGAFESNLTPDNKPEEFVLRCVLEQGYYIRLPKSTIFEEVETLQDYARFCKGWQERISLISDTAEQASYRLYRVEIGHHSYDALYVDNGVIADFYRLCKYLYVFDVVNINKEPWLKLKADQDGSYVGSFIFASEIVFSGKEEIKFCESYELKHTILEFLA
jgi:hypothetical protein